MTKKNAHHAQTHHNKEDEAAAKAALPTDLVPTEKWEGFPSKAPTEALGMIYDAWRGVPVDQDLAVLAGFNVAGYAYGQGFAKRAPLFGQASAPAMAKPAPTKEEVEAAFAAIKAGIDEEGLMKAGDPAEMALPWGIILPIVAQILQQWLHF